VSAAIEVRGLTKAYGDLRAVDALDLRVERGEVYGFLGLNGAGKTTTIRALLGMVRPTAGTVHLLGEPVRPGGRGPWARVGHLVEAPAAYPDLTVRENLEVARRLQGVRDRGATGAAIQRLGLAPYADRLAGTLSLGNLQRLGLARALLHAPELVILDEPANGLDPAGVVEVREMLAAMVRDHGVTVFMSSHVLSEVDRMATRIAILHRGRLVEEIDAAGLERRRRAHLAVDVRDRPAARASLQARGYAVDAAADGSLVLADRRAIDAPDEVARALVAAGTPPLRLVVQHEDLEEHFLRLTREAP
jgi:ABC-2 type transport system ATP-binding protein